MVAVVSQSMSRSRRRGTAKFKPAEKVGRELWLALTPLIIHCGSMSSKIQIRLQYDDQPFEGQARRPPDSVTSGHVSLTLATINFGGGKHKLKLWERPASSNGSRLLS